MEFSQWVNQQEPIFITEGWLDNLQKIASPQLAKYLPLALKEIDQDPDLKSIVENRSLFLALYHAFRRVTQPEFMQALKRVADTDIQQLPFQELAKIEILIRKKFMPVWNVIVKTLNLFHITPLITQAIPKFKEFVDCFIKLSTVENKHEFRNLAKCSAAAFLQFTHQVTSTSLFSGLAAKIVAILGMLGLAAKMTVVVMIVWILLLILKGIKGKIDSSKTSAWVIGLIIKIFSPGHEEKSNH